MAPPRYKRRDVRLSTAVKASPARVWRCLTSARELCAWWTERAETDARNGGRLRLVWAACADEPAREARGCFVDLEPGSKAAWLWARAGRGVPALVSFFIEPRGRGAAVMLVHGGFPASAASRSRYRDWARFWEDCLAKLAVYAESGRTFKAESATLQDVERLRRAKAARPGVLLAR